MSKNKSLGSELSASLSSKTGPRNEIESEPTSVTKDTRYTEGGFAAVSARLSREVNTRATIATTVRLPEESDRALKEACAKFQKSKADLVKVCVEEYLKANNFLRDGSLQN